MCSTKTWTTMQYNTIQYNQLPSPPKKLLMFRTTEWVTRLLPHSEKNLRISILRYDPTLRLLHVMIDRSKISLLWNSKKLCLYVLATNKRRQTFFSHYVLIPPTALLWDASRPTMAFLPWINQSKRKENKTTCSIQQQKSGRTIERTTISTSERRPVPIHDDDDDDRISYFNINSQSAEQITCSSLHYSKIKIKYPSTQGKHR